MDIFVSVLLGLLAAFMINELIAFFLFLTSTADGCLGAKKFIARIRGYEVIRCLDFQGNTHFCFKKKGELKGWWKFYHVWPVSLVLLGEEGTNQLILNADGTIKDNWIVTWELV